MEPENTGWLEEEHHLNQTIILTFFFFGKQIPPFLTMRIFASWDALAYSALVGSMRCRQRSVEIWWWLREREKHALWSHQSDKEAALILSPPENY